MNEIKSQHHGLVGLKDYTNEKSVSSEQSEQIRDSDKKCRNIKLNFRTDMKQGWEHKKLKDVCEKITDGTHQTPKYFESGYIFLSSKNVTSGKIDWENIKYIDEVQHLEMQKRVSPKKGDILLAKNGTTGVAAIVDKDVEFDIYVSLAWLRSKGEVLPEFLLHFINSPNAKSQFNRRLKGIGVPNLHLEEIREVDISYPKSLPEQQRIVSILDKAFAAIDKAKANAEQNLNNAKELFESYLEKCLNHRLDGLKHSTEKNSVPSEKSDKISDSDKWEVKKLGEVCHFVRGPFGGSLKKNIFKPSGYAVYEQQHAIYNQFEEIKYFIDEAKFNEMKRFELNEGDLIMSCSGTMGKVAIVPNGIKKGIINQALLKISTGKQILNQYLKLWMESESFQNSLKKYSGGAAIQNVASVSVLKSIEVPLPSIKTQQTIVRQLDALRAETQKLEAVYQQKIANLEELKKSILQKAFAGELKTENAVVI